MGCGLNSDKVCNWYSLGYRHEFFLTAPGNAGALEFNYLRVLRATGANERGPDVFMYAGLGYGGRTNVHTGYSEGNLSNRAGAAISWTNLTSSEWLNHSFRFAMGIGARTNLSVLNGDFSISPEVWMDFSVMTFVGFQVSYHGLDSNLTGPPTLGLSLRLAMPHVF